MKKLLPLLFIAFLGWVESAQATGIEFQNLSWSEILVKAQADDKVIFLDAYTSWCGPCKKMTREVFSATEVGDYYNARFVSVKIDMEKGEGPQLAREYGVRAYPTLLFIDAQGQVLHRAAGYHDVQEFLALGDLALNPQGRLSTLERRFAEGERDPEFLWKYTQARLEIQDGSHLPVAEAYLATQSDWSTEQHMDLIFHGTTDADSPLFDYLAQNKAVFMKQYGEHAVLGRLQDLIYQKVYATEEETSLEQVDRLFARAYPENAARMSANFRMSYYRQLGDRQNYAKAAVDYFDSFPDASPDELNDVAWTFYQVIEDKKLLKQAAKWAKRSVKLDPQYYNNDTLAGIYHKMGKTKPAIKAAEMAIQIAKNTGEDYSKTTALLKELQQ